MSGWIEEHPRAMAVIVLAVLVVFSTGFTLFAIWTTAGKVAGVLFAAGAGYRVSLQISPDTACFRCHGTGRVRGWVFRWVRHRDRLCHGTGRLPRLGTLLFMRETARQIRSAGR